MSVTMNVGVAELDITPGVGIELAGFALRPQPSTRIVDRLFVRALYLQDAAERLIWIHADLLSIDQALADRIRAQIGAETALPYSRVVVSTTHTHSGPATFEQNGVGKTDPAYVPWLESQIQQVVRLALGNVERCTLTSVQGTCDLGRDRRKRASAHTDPRVGALAWRRMDGKYKAVFLSYSMHPVCLRDSGISADWPGATARVLGDSLPGRPIALVAAGACGNIDPPMVGVPPKQAQEWGRLIAACALEKLRAAKPDILEVNRSPLRVVSATVELPLEPCQVREIEEYAARCLADPDGHLQFGEKFKQAIEAWRLTMIGRYHRGEPFHAPAVLVAIHLGETTILTLNAEVFSKFTEMAKSGLAGFAYTVGCTNGMIGYLPPSEAYEEGTYEVLWSMFFYNMPRPRKGGFELLADHARQLLSPEEAVRGISHAAPKPD